MTENKEYKNVPHYQEEEEQEIRNNIIDEFFEELQKYQDDDMWLRLKMSSIYQIADNMKQ